MSWDVIIFNLPDNVKTVLELTDESMTPLGSRDYILSVISSVFPQADLSDPTWVVLDGDDYSIEFSLGQDEQLETLMLHVRGDIEAINAIENFCKATGWRAFDSSVGEFIDFTDPNRDRGIKRWQEYRDFTTDKHEQE